MGAVSYMFVVRSLRHEHEIVAADIDENGFGRTSTEQGHQHEFRIQPGDDADDVENWTEFDHANGHRHRIFTHVIDGKKVYTVGPREDLEIARVPILAREWVDEEGAKKSDFYMIERDGQPNHGPKAGVNVGQEWGYRRFVEGNTPMAAVWLFRNVNEERFPHGGLLIEPRFVFFAPTRETLTRASAEICFSAIR